MLHYITNLSVCARVGRQLQLLLLFASTTCSTILLVCLHMLEWAISCNYFYSLLRRPALLYYLPACMYSSGPSAATTSTICFGDLLYYITCLPVCTRVGSQL